MIGKTILHYKILSKLGEGGMGVVYRAQDTKLDREVAIKFLPRQIAASSDEHERFKIEAKAAAALNHPNIATIHAIEKADEEAFIVMEYVRGTELKSLIKGHPKGLPVEDAIKYAVQVADGLSAAHDAGIIHRDIKSANIIINEKSQAKIMDFGLAKVTGAAEVTKAGTTLGTAAYMSPEQARGEKADNRSDIWAIGAVLYEMLTGNLPFGGDYEQTVIYAILHEEPTAIDAVRESVPPEIVAAVVKALAKDPDQRFQTTADFMSALSAAPGSSLSGGSRHSTKTPDQSGVRRGEKRNTHRQYGLLLAPILLIAVAVLIIRQSGFFAPGEQARTSTPSATWEKSIAVLPFADLSPQQDQEYFCDGMTEQLITNLSHLKDLKVIARTSVMTFKATTKSIPEIGATLNVSYVLTGSIRKAGDRIRVSAQLVNVDDSAPLWAADYDRELRDIFGVQDSVSQAIAAALFEQLSPKDAQAVMTQQTDNVPAYESYLKGQYFHHGRFLYYFRQGDFDKSEQMLMSAVKLDPNYGLAYAGLADLYDTHLRYFENNEEYVLLRQQYAEKAVQFNPNSAYTNTVMGFTHWGMGRNEQAFASIQRAIEISPNDWYSTMGMSLLMGHFGLRNQSITLITRAIGLDPLFAGSYAVLGIAHSRLGEFDKAERAFHRALEIDPEHMQSVNALAEQAALSRRFDQAEELLAKAEEINPDHLRNNIVAAWLQAARGNREGALSLFKDEIVYILLGMKDQAINKLNEQHEFGWPLGFAGPSVGNYLSLKNLTIYDSLRDDPRFIEVLDKEKARYDEFVRSFGQ